MSPVAVMLREACEQLQLRYVARSIWDTEVMWPATSGILIAWTLVLYQHEKFAWFWLTPVFFNLIN